MGCPGSRASPEPVAVSLVIGAGKDVRPEGVSVKACNLPFPIAGGLCMGSGSAAVASRGVPDGLS